jgi:hypothetical protein
MLEAGLPAERDRVDEVHDRWLRVFYVPPISARALGVFRALLGTALLAILIADPLRAVPRDLQRAYSPLADIGWVHALAASGTGTLVLQLVACASAVTFALGLRAGRAYAVLVAALLLRAILLLVRRGVHDWDLPIVTLLGLLAVPWADAPGLLQRRAASSVTGANPVSRAYGFAVWLPGLTIGLAFAAAAYAKLHRSGLAWITGGAVRYHFVEDGRNTPFTLGLWVATQPDVAVVLSTIALAIEASFFLVVFARGWRTRAAFGLAGAGLMAGFYVFQGVRWWPWLMLFTAFLPWNRREVVPAGTGSRDLTPRHAAVVMALVAAQAWASSRAVEIEPLLSNYPMYASTYDSPEYFERAQARVRFEAEGTDVTDRVDTAGGAETLRASIEQPGQDGSPPSVPSPALVAFRERYARLYGEAPAAIDVVLFKRPFDWQAGRYLPPVRERLGTVLLPR